MPSAPNPMPAAPSRPPEAAQHLAALTGLRFVAATMIVLLHAKLYFDWSWLSLVPVTFSQGVSFFFVLSGFILSHAYKGRRIGWGRFMWLRVARLWPVHAVTLALVMVLMPGYALTFDGPGWLDKQYTLIANVTLTQAFVPVLAYQFSYNAVAWSISVEMFFYALFPLLLAGMGTRWARTLALCAVPVALIALATALLGISGGEGIFRVTAGTLTYAWPPARLLEFGLGMATYRLWSVRKDGPTKRWSGVAEILAIALAAWFVVQGAGLLASRIDWSLALRNWTASCASMLAFAVLIHVFASGRGAVGRFMATPALVWLGEVSFALYMIHQPLMKYLHLVVPALSSAWIVLPLCLILAAALHHGVERPARLLLVQGLPAMRARVRPRPS